MKENLAASQPAARAATAVQRAWAMLLAVALCMGLMPNLALAEEGGDAETFSVALTIVDTSDSENPVLYNGKVGGMTSADTVADLLAAAGFAEAASAEDTAGDDGAYYDSWGSPTFRGNNSVEQEDGSWAYWVTMFDGDSANYASAMLTSNLQENGHYQYVYTSDSTFEYSDEVPQFALYTVYDPLTGEVASDSDTDADTDSDSGDSGNQATTVDEAVFNSLFQNIANSYEGTSEEWKALALAAIGNVSSVDVDTLVANAKASLSDHGTTNLQRYILALTAVGETEVAAELVEAMATSSTATSQINGQIFALLAYDSGNYSIPADANMTEDELVSAILSAQLSSGGWAWSGDTADADITAMALTALASRASDDSEVAAAVEKGIAALRAMQYEDGGFRSSGDSVDSPVNVGTTAYVVIAMCALGIDPATSWATENGSTPLSALLSQATSDNTAFLYNGEANDMATYQGFLALVAYQGLKNTGAAYNVYTQAKLGQAGLNIEEEEESVAEESGSDDSSETSTLAKTGDPAAPLAVGAAAVALCALVTGITAARRMRPARDLSSRR